MVCAVCLSDYMDVSAEFITVAYCSAYLYTMQWCCDCSMRYDMLLCVLRLYVQCLVVTVAEYVLMYCMWICSL